MSELKSDTNVQGGGGQGIARPLPKNENKLCYTVPEAAALLGFSRNFGYELAKTGQIPILRFWKRMVVPKAKFDELLRPISDKMM